MVGVQPWLGSEPEGGCVEQAKGDFDQLNADHLTFSTYFFAAGKVYTRFLILPCTVSFKNFLCLTIIALWTFSLLSPQSLQSPANPRTTSRKRKHSLSKQLKSNPAHQYIAKRPWLSATVVTAQRGERLHSWETQIYFLAPRSPHILIKRPNYSNAQSSQRIRNLSQFLSLAWLSSECPH